MTEVGKAFYDAFGPPDPAAPPGIRFEEPFQENWELVQSEIGSGWYLDGFFYLFGEGLDALKPCLDAWSFVVPPHDNRMIIGRNAYGAIFLLENPKVAYQERVCVVDPFTVSYYSNNSCLFMNLLGAWLPERILPDQFVDEGPYKEWKQANGDVRLRMEDVLGFKVPEGLGGELTVDNLQLDGIVEYYESTAPIYAKAFEEMNNG